MKVRRRADRVPLTLAQPTAFNERLASLLSAFLLRQPVVAPPSLDEHRTDWQLVGTNHPSNQDRNILLLVIVEDDTSDDAVTARVGMPSWPDEAFVQALQVATRPSPFFFVWQLTRGGWPKALPSQTRLSTRYANSSSSTTDRHFSERLRRILSTLSPRTDVYVVVGTPVALDHLAAMLQEQAVPANDTSPQPLLHPVKGVLSLWPLRNSTHSVATPPPHLPDGCVHWAIRLFDQARRQPPSLKTPLITATTTHPRTLVTWLDNDDIDNPPPTPWLVRATVWWASAVQSIVTDHPQKFLPPSSRL